MNWDEEYSGGRRVWGDSPSQAAIAAEGHLQTAGPIGRTLRVLDIGCGYGRDAAFLTGRLQCTILGIDPSPKAIEMASAAFRDVPNVSFRCCGFADLADRRFDVVLASNLYQLLDKDDRQLFARSAVALLEPAGWLVLCTMSSRDPEHHGKGTPVAGEPHSFFDKHYLHFCTEDELRNDFAGLRIAHLREVEYMEPRPGGAPHHHVSWILTGQRPGVD